MKSINNLKIALVHDFLVQYGGAEKVLEVLSEMFPEAPIYTLLYDKETMHRKFEDKKIKVSFLQKFPNFLKKRYRWLLPFMSPAVEALDFREFDLVISSSGAWSKGIVTRLSTDHVAYIHSPMRFIWDYKNNYLKENKKSEFFLNLLFSYLRVWDKMASERPDFLISNSAYTQKRVNKYYRRNSQIIYPPVDTKSMRSSEKKHFIVVSRLSSYKKIDKLIEAFNELNLPLIIIGEGREKKKLEEIAKSNIKIVGWQEENDLLGYLSQARAFLFSAIDDFGIAPVEAMRQGIPIIAFRKGGALEYVEEGKTGEFFDSQNKESIKKTVETFISKENQYDREYISKQAKRFSKERFKREINDFLEKNILNNKY